MKSCHNSKSHSQNKDIENSKAGNESETNQRDQNVYHSLSSHKGMRCGRSEPQNIDGKNNNDGHINKGCDNSNRYFVGL